MFHNPEKKITATHNVSVHNLTMTSTAKHLLDEPKRADLLHRIKQSSGFDTARFDTICQTLLNHFIAYTQELPETANSYYALPGGLLDHALNRTEAALQLFRQLTIEDTADGLSKEQELWLYALFSACILQGVGKLIVDYTIGLFDIKKQPLRQWNPLLENLGTVGRFYHYEFTGANEDEKRRLLNVLLAYKLMPESGFNWIAGHPAVFSAWLALLNEDPNEAGMLGLIFERAEAIALQRDLETFLIHYNAANGGRSGKIGTFIDKSPESNFDHERAIGAEFLKWLALQLENGRFAINKTPIMMLPAGLHITSEVFQFFLRENPEKIKNWQIVRNGLISLGVHLPNLNRDTLNGLVLNKFAQALPEHVQFHDTTNNNERKVSAVDILSFHKSPKSLQTAQHLSSLGKWQAVEIEHPTLKTGFLGRE